ncbi:MAG: hypothetical protein LBG60_14865 [Bifidobacteriaceae bacterium]|nr:hypothetical protein [Bifidobacteriaceae bacterium]
MRRTVKVTAERSGGWWVLEAPDVGSVSQCRVLSRADPEMREAIAHQLGEPESAFDIEVEVVLPDEYRAQMARSRDLRAEAEHMGREAASARASAAKALRAAHLSVRDIGHVMGVSHQRAHQLLTS